MASVSSSCLDEPTDSAKMITKPYIMGCSALISEIQWSKGNPRDRVIRFLDFTLVFSHDVGLCMRELPNSLTDRAIHGALI